MAKITINQIYREFNGSLQPLDPQPESRLEILNSTGTTVLYTVGFPLSGLFELEIPDGTYVARFTVVPAINTGSMRLNGSNDATNTALFTSAYDQLKSGALVYTSNTFTLSGLFNRISLFCSQDFAFTNSTFAATASLGVCDGVAPNKTRRVYFNITGWSGTVELSDSLDPSWAIIQPSSTIYFAQPVGTVVTYYIRNNGTTISIPLTFSDCSVAPPSAPVVSVPSILLTQSASITFTPSGTGTLKVYRANSLVQTITNAVSPYEFSAGTLGTGSYTFSITGPGGESAQSTGIAVSSAPVFNTCGLVHLQLLGSWNEPSGPYTNRAIKFSNTGDLPYNGQIVTDSPLTFIIRGKNQLQRPDFALAAALTADVVNCLSGDNTGIGGLAEPSGFPMPPGYERGTDNVYRPTGSTPSASVDKQITVNITNACDATTFQVGITENYTNGIPAESEVVRWLDGLTHIVSVRSGVYPWVFVRDKANPANVSAPTKTLLS
jgi:hypothetical protein